MSRVIDLAINEHILGNRFSNEEILRFSDNTIDIISLVSFLSDKSMIAYTCCKIEREHYVTVEGVNYTVKHRDLPIALSLACLASVGLDKVIVDDIKFEYNFEKGIL